MAPKITKRKRDNKFQSVRKRNQKKSGKKMDIVGKLPLEVAELILIRLNPDSVLNAWNTSPNWRFVMDTEYFWKRKCLKDNFFLTDSSVKSKVFKNLSEKLDPSHAMYTYSQGLNYNWKNENSYLTSLGDELFYRTIHFFDDEKIIFTTSNNELVVMDYATGFHDQMVSLDGGEEIQILERHEDLLICITCHNMYVWNITNMECIFSMASEMPDCIIELKIYDNFTLALLDAEGVFSTINLQSGIVRNVWNNVENLVIYKNLAVLQIGLNEVTILNMESKAPLVSKFTCCEEQLMVKMMSRENYLICFCGNGNVSTWDIVTQKKVMSINLKDPIMFFDNIELLEKDRFIFSKCDSTAIEIWDFLVGTCVMKITTNENIYHVIATARYIFAMVNFNASVEVFCSKTGKPIATLSSEIYYNSDGFALATESKLMVLMAKETYQGFVNEIVILDHDRKLSIP